MLSKEQIEDFDTEGYIVVEDVFDEADFRPLKAEFSEVIHQGALRLYEQGKLSNLYEDEPFERRLAQIATEAPELAALLQTRAHKGPALFSFMKHPKILDRVETILGGDILCHPSYNLHPRLPNGWTTAHQDAGYYLPDGDNTLIVACLVTLVETTPESGCLWVAPRRHREGVLHHLKGDNGLDIPLKIVAEEERKLVPTRAGSMIVFSSTLPHGSLVNRSNTVRWSMDLRYQKLGEPTGRWYAPGFVARSRAQPALECPHWEAWVADVERVEREAEAQPQRPRSRWN